MVGLPDRHYEALYQPLFLQHAAYCQELPASEAHHHCSPGGALRHGIEVALHAMKLRRKMLLPVGATAEELAAKQDRWTYAVVSAALFHDFGKPLTDLIVEMLDQEGRYLDTWRPWRGAMGEQGCAAYRMQYRRDRRHGLHERVPAFHLHRLMPLPGLEWIAEDLDVFQEWSATMVGLWEQAGVIGEIVQTADARSVAEDLAGEHRQSPGARQKPLHQRLMTGLRYLLDQGELPLNARGAAGWVDQECLWLVSKRTLDALREHLEQEGHGGIPQRNDRLMDALQQSGCLIPNGDKAIWHVRVIADSWPKAAELTVLRFPLNKVWPDPAAAPASFEGSVIVEGESAPAMGVDDRDGSLDAEAVTAEPDKPESADTGDPDEASIFAESASEPEPAQPEQSEPPSPSIQEEAEETPKETLYPLSESGQRFLAWLRDNLAKGLLEVNTPSGRVHRVAEGLLLISPGIFKDYRDPNPEASWQQVQRRFSRLKLHRKRADGTNIHAYDVLGEKSRKRSVVKGYLLPNGTWEEVFPGLELPEPNDHLRRKESPQDEGSVKYGNASLEQGTQGGKR